MSYYNSIQSILIAIVLIFCGTHTTFAQSGPNVVKWVIEKKSTLRVDGRSNVNSFTCNINEYAGNDTIICAYDLSKSIKLSGKMQMDIVSFNCHSNMITKDLRKSLKASEYPKMVIHFLTLQWMPALHDTTEVIKGWVEVELAGVTKRFELSYSFTRGDSGNILLNGGRSFNFSDFKLSPPHKLAGLVKVRDDFDVNFELILKTV
ncbi:MAG: hypothetical protein ABI416_16860 [Ginsengibacter sp.]